MTSQVPIVIRRGEAGMRTLFFTVAIVIGGSSFGVSSAVGRQVEDWPYDRLFNESDLVVVATAVSAAPTDDKTRDNPWKAELQGIETTFQVKLALKGEAAGALKVLHFRLPSGKPFPDGPLLVSFRTKPVQLDLRANNIVMNIAMGPNDYILFLKATEAAHYEPVSGRIDPKLSVRELHGTMDWIDKLKRDP